jgi:hypothetical protein
MELLLLKFIHTHFMPTLASLPQSGKCQLQAALLRHKPGYDLGSVPLSLKARYNRLVVRMRL